MDGPAKRLGNLVRSRLRLLRRHLEQNQIVQGAVTVAGFPIQTARKRVARYRQSDFGGLPREDATGGESHREILVDPGDRPLHQWVHDHHRKQFRSDGYMVIENVVPANLVANAVREIAGFVGADLADRTTWYRAAGWGLDGMVPMHHAQSLWDVRQYPGIYQVFAEFFGTRRLMVDMNRCIFRPPVNRRFPKISRGTIHWDTDPRRLRPAAVQGVVLLSDVCHEGGGFQCLPDVFRNLNAWLKRYARRDDFNFFYPGLDHWNTTQVEGKAGDVILWSTKLPHGSATNLSDRPRIAAFVSMGPCGEDTQLRESMKTWWLSKRAPDYWRGLPGQLDPEPGPAAVLSHLGFKLIGVSRW